MGTEVVATSKIFQRGKIIIPSEVRRSLGVEDGDRLVWIKESDGRYFVENAKKHGARYP